jgi:hypothetical protein
MKDIPQLREKQIEQLSAYIANPKFLDLSEPATGKTPPVCVYSYFCWTRFKERTLWTMPKSLLKKNLREMVRFTEFEVKNVDRYTPGDDVAILRTDRAQLTKGYTGPTIESDRKRRGYRVKVLGKETTTIELRDSAGGPLKMFYQKDDKWIVLGATMRTVNTKPVGLEIEPILGPDGEPQPVTRNDPEVFKDVIKSVAADGAKVVITTFKFAALYWKRILEAMPDINLFLVDELHMPGGYSTPTSEATESFYWINRHCKKFIGMTGTLINGRLDSAFPALHVIEPRYYGSLQGFYYEHAAITDDYGRVILWKNEEKLKQIIGQHSIRRTFEEVYGKEDVAFFTEYVDVGEAVRPHYDQFHDQAMLELENGDVLDGTLPGVALIRARQILAHPETMGLNGDALWTEKDDRLEVHLREGLKCLVFAALQPEQERILRLAKSLGLRAELINGNVSDKNRNRINELAEAGQLDVIVASGPTVAVGYNWECFDHVIFASIDYMDVNILQAYRRASRGTRTTTLRVTFLQYRNSIDQRQYAIVKAKSQLANRVDPTRMILEFAEADNDNDQGDVSRRAA